MQEFECLVSAQGGVLLRLRATPNARQTAAEAEREGRLRLRVAAPPVDDKANRELLRWVADAFGLRSSAVSIVRGERGREKDVLLAGIEPAAAAERLAQILGA